MPTSSSYIIVTMGWMVEDGTFQVVSRELFSTPSSSGYIQVATVFFLYDPLSRSVQVLLLLVPWVILPYMYFLAYFSLYLLFYVCHPLRISTFGTFLFGGFVVQRIVL